MVTAPRTDSKPQQILVIDDEAMIREVVSENLSMRFGDKVEVHEANCGSDGIELLKRQHFDAVICDLDMPNGHGMNVLSYFSKADRKPYFLFYTGSDAKIPSMGERYLGVVQKPNIENVILKIRDCLCLK